jgi:hypothetical protein
MHSSNGYAGRVEFDPTGADVKLQAPTAPDPGSGQGDVDFRHVAAMMDSKYAALNNPAGGCVVDNFETGCSNAMAVVNFGTGNSTAFVDNGTVTMHELAHSVLLSASPQAIFAPAGNSLAGITPGDSDSDAAKLISGGAARQDSVTGNWSGEMTIAPATVTGLSTGVVSLASSAELQKIDSFQRGLNNAMAKTQGILQSNNDCSKFFGPDAVAALKALANLLRLANNYDQGMTTATGVRQDYASTIVVNGAQNTVAYRLPTGAQVYRNGPFFMGPGRKPLGGYPAGSLGAQITALLHELAHNIITDKKSKTLIPNDGGDPGLSVKNTEKILEHCEKDIFKAAK